MSPMPDTCVWLVLPCSLKPFICGIGAIVSRILKYANRPWDCLGLPAYTPAEHTRRHYRQLSLLIHPDKCDHPRAQEAMAILNNAFKKVTR